DSDAKGKGWNLGRLTPKQLRRLETLVEAAAADPGYFDRIRAHGLIRAKAKELVDAALRPPARPVVEEAGALVLPASLFAFVEEPEGRIWPGLIGRAILERRGS